MRLIALGGVLLVVLAACDTKSEDSGLTTDSGTDASITPDPTGSGPVDEDGDGVKSDVDPDDDDKYRCGDADADGCDDCTHRGFADPAKDGYDHDGDGICELALDPDCLHGAHATNDPHRLEGCIQLALTNLDRITFADESGNADPIAWSEEAWAVAVAHSKDMCLRGYFDHTNPEGLDPTGRAAEMGYDFGLAENIAINWDPFATHYAFMAEPTCIGHRSNILQPKATLAGVGVYVCDRGTWAGALFTTENYIWNFGIADAPWCEDNSCQMPPAPITEAAQWCPAGDCEPPRESMLGEWGCL